MQPHLTAVAHILYTMSAMEQTRVVERNVSHRRQSDLAFIIIVEYHYDHRA